MRRSAWRPSRNCEHPAVPRFGQARQPRSGRSEAQWLERSVDRRTIPRRDGRSACGRAAVRELARRSRRAGGREAGGRRSIPPQFRIQSECALTYMNARSGQNLSAVRTPLWNVGAHVVKSPEHSAMARDRARICRTTATCIWGVSDPLIAAVGPRSGGGRGGRSRPDASIVVTDSDADCDTGGRQRRPIDSGEVPDPKEHRHFVIDAITFLSGLVDQRTIRAKGDHSSRVCGPPVFSSLSRFPTISRGERWASNAGSAWYSGTRRIES